MSYQVFIFDFDGTLGDSLPWFRSSFNSIAKRHGFRQLEREDIEKLRLVGAREAMRKVGLPLWKLPFVMRNVRKMMAEIPDPIPLFNGIPEMLRTLTKAGKTVAIVSSNSETTIRRALGPELENQISHYFCGAGLLTKARQLKKALRIIRIPVKDVIFIGDEIRDAEAARRIGVNFGAVTWGYAITEALLAQNPDQSYLTPADIAT